MIIYQETKKRFIDDVDHNAIRARLVEAFRAKTGSVPSDERVWAEEYSRFSLVLRKADVEDDIQVAIEYHISAAGRFRVDVLLAGSDGCTDNGMIIELKAWDRVDISDYDGLVYSPIAGGSHTQHPCVQASKYKGLILRFNQDVRAKSISLHSAAYLFNLSRRNPEPLEDVRYHQALRDSRLFLANDVDALCQFVKEIVPKKPTKDLIFLIENGRMVPAPELISRVSSMLEGNEEFELIDEQNEAFQIIRHQVMNLKDFKRRHVFVVEGGPGTGKSVVAVRLLAELLKAKRMSFFVAPNRAFRETVIEFLSKGNRGYREDGNALIQSPWRFHNIDYMKDPRNDVLVIDEAHRLKSKAYRYAGKSMVEDMIRAARISIFFIDETQRVSWNDVGSVAAIKKAANKFGAEYHAPFMLRAQYRCNGSTGYLNWLDDVLQIRATANFENWGDGQYEFRVFDRAEDLYSALKSKNSNNKARLIAGYSWAWPSGKGRRRGASVNHVQADKLSLPWNYDRENWATSSDGIEQVGCVHTSQGIEFDWLGVLVGPDLTFRNGKVVGEPLKRAKTDASLKGWKKELADSRGDPEKMRAVLDKVQSIIKSTYKVLLSRGRKGCYVWCADKALREYLKSRLALASQQTVEVNSRLKYLQEPAGKKYAECLPVYSMEVAAGPFGKPDLSECIGWVRTPASIRGSPLHFVAQVIGRSMEPLIPDGSYCVFRFGVVGDRTGRIVLAQIAGYTDPETGGRYTVKKYRSEKVADEDQGWRHLSIQLLPLNPEFEPIVITGSETDNINIVAEFVGVLT
ncbi:MAG: DUF2075 domain-containing protein [Kiritimatiellae bacterium]|nr:DUF2075 domain-containing protein [Kiritimatiellia bacterium]